MALDINQFDPNFLSGPEPRRVVGNILKGMGPALSDSMSYYRDELLPGARAAGRGILSLTSQEGINRKVSQTRQQLLSDAQKQSKLLRMRIEGQGGGIGTSMGADVSTFNAANREANDLQAHFATPQGQYELYQIINQLQKTYPGLDVTALLSQIFASNPRPQPQRGGGLLGSIGQLAGIASAFIPGGQAVAPILAGMGAMSGSNGATDGWQLPVTGG